MGSGAIIGYGRAVKLPRMFLLWAACGTLFAQEIWIPQWIQDLPPAPPQAIEQAEQVARRYYGNERYEKFFKLQLARTEQQIQRIYFSHRVEGPDYEVFLSVVFFVDTQGNVGNLIDAQGGVTLQDPIDCRQPGIICPPFTLPLAQVIETAKKAGVKGGKKKPSHCSGQLKEGLCATLYFHFKYRRYVWGVINRTSGWSNLLHPTSWFFDETGKTAIIDAATGTLYSVSRWGAIKGLTVHLLKLETLIELKEETAREQDKAVLPILRRTLGEKSRTPPATSPTDSSLKTAGRNLNGQSSRPQQRCRRSGGN